MDASYQSKRDGFAAIKNALKVGDPTKTADGLFVEIADQASKWLLQEANRTDAAAGAAKMEIAAIENSIVAKLAIKEGQYSGEIRAHFRSLPDNERMSIAMQAIKDRDADTLSSILLGPAYLSGFSENQRHILRDQYAQAYAAPLLTRKAAIERAVTINSETSDEAMFGIEELFPRQRVQEIKSKSAQARAARLAIG